MTINTDKMRRTKTTINVDNTRGDTCGYRSVSERPAKDRARD